MLPRRHGDSVAVTPVAVLCFPSGRINKGLSSQPGHLGIVQCLRVASDNYEARQGVTEPDDEVTIGLFSYSSLLLLGRINSGTGALVSSGNRSAGWPRVLESRPRPGRAGDAGG